MQEVKPQLLLSVPALTGNFMKKIKAGISKKGKFISYIFNKGVKSGIIYKGDGWNKVKFSKRIINYLPYKFAKIFIFSKLKDIFGGELEFCIGGGALLDIKQQNFFNAIGIPVFQGYDSE